MLTVNIQQAENICTKLLRATQKVNYEGGTPLIPFLQAGPGMGKSAMLRNVAKHFKLKLVDVRLSQEDPVCLNGALSITGTRSSFLPPERFPLDTDEVPEGYEGWLIFFDELPDAPRSIQSAAYKILLEREIGAHRLHPKALMVAAGNNMSDNAGVSGDLSSALKSRLVHLAIHSDAEAFSNNIAKWKWDVRIQAYLRHQKDKVNTFKKYLAGSSDSTYCCERTWEMVNTYLKSVSPNQESKISAEELPVLVGMIGSTASEFVAFTNSFDDLPDINDILKDPTTAKVPTDQGARFLLISILALRLNDDNQDILPAYVSRLGTSFMYPFLNTAWMFNDNVIGYKSVQPFLDKFGKLSSMAN